MGEAGSRERYWLYSVTRTEEVDRRVGSGPVLVEVPHGKSARDFHSHQERERFERRRWPVRPELEEAHPPTGRYWFTRTGEERPVPLTPRSADEFEARGWAVEPIIEIVDAKERELLRRLSEHQERRGWGRVDFSAYLDPYGDYLRVAVVRRYLPLTEAREALFRAHEAGLINGRDALVLAERIHELRRELEDKGWQFHDDGTVTDPSSNDQSTELLDAAIRELYQSLKTRYDTLDSVGAIIPYIQRVIRESGLDEPTEDRIRDALGAFEVEPDGEMS